MNLILEKFNVIGFWAINNLAGHFNGLDLFMVFLAKWLGYVLILYILWQAWKSINFKNYIILTIGSAIIARFVLVELIRYFIYSPRPFTILENVNQLLAHEPTSSFPSGHVSFFFGLAFGSYFLNKKTGSWLLVLAGLIGVARVYVGIHWPLDIIAGAVLGWATAFLLNKVLARFQGKRRWK
ncbi:MAG: phosphatase PAP2 family protein [Candidatus Paceibacterota bacterium]